MEYEVVREILNSCSKNQMRDVFFDEVETDDPLTYVRNLLKEEPDELTVGRDSDGSLIISARCKGLRQRFLFTAIA